MLVEEPDQNDQRIRWEHHEDRILGSSQPDLSDQKNRKGHYALINIDAAAPVVHELERRLRINEDVMRFKTIRVEALDGSLTDGPSRPRRAPAARAVKAAAMAKKVSANLTAGRINQWPRSKPKGARSSISQTFRRVVRLDAKVRSAEVFRRERPEDRLQGRETAPQRYISEKGKIVPARITAVSASNANSRARSNSHANLPLPPFAVQ